MPNRTIYVGPRQDAIWAQAVERANDEGVSMSSLVIRGLRLALAQPPREPLPDELRAVVTADASTIVDQVTALADRVAALEAHHTEETPS